MGLLYWIISILLVLKTHIKNRLIRTSDERISDIINRQASVRDAHQDRRAYACSNADRIWQVPKIYFAVKSISCDPISSDDGKLNCLRRHGFVSCTVAIATLCAKLGCLFRKGWHVCGYRPTYLLTRSIYGAIDGAHVCTPAGAILHPSSSGRSTHRNWSAKEKSTASIVRSNRDSARWRAESCACAIDYRTYVAVQMKINVQPWCILDELWPNTSVS
jgi:hypothetical protein